MTTRILALSLLMAACVAKDQPSECMTNAMCDLRSGGKCTEASSHRLWCTYDDSNCGSQRKWSPYAGDGLADLCVDVPDAGSTIGDGPMPDGSTGTATIIAVRDSCPVSGAVVVFHHSDGSPYSTLSTPVTGSVTANIQSGDMVSVATLANNDYRLTTVFGLRPGDVLRVGEESSQRTECPNAITALVNVEWPGSFAGASHFRMAWGGTSPVEYDLVPFSFGVGTETVDDQGKITLVAFAHDQDYNLLAASALKNLAPNATEPFPAWESPTTITFSYRNVPAVKGINVNVVPVVNGLGVYTEFGGSSVQLPAQLQPDLIRYHVIVRYTDFPHTAYGYVGTHDFTRPAYDVDLSNLLPAINTATLNTAVSSRPVVEWTTDGNGVFDGTVASVSWSRPSGYRMWRMVVPPDLRSVTAPALPSSLEDWVPPSDVRFDIYAVDMAESPALSGYEDFKRQYYYYAHGRADASTGLGTHNIRVPVRRTIREEFVTP